MTAYCHANSLEKAYSIWCTVPCLPCIVYIWCTVPCLPCIVYICTVCSDCLKVGPQLYMNQSLYFCDYTFQKCQKFKKSVNYDLYKSLKLIAKYWCEFCILYIQIFK